MYPTTAIAASSGDSPQPHAIGTAAINATNGPTTNTHSMTTAAVDCVASKTGLGPAGTDSVAATGETTVLTTKTPGRDQPERRTAVGSLVRANKLAGWSRPRESGRHAERAGDRRCVACTQPVTDQTG